MQHRYRRQSPPRAFVPARPRHPRSTRRPRASNELGCASCAGARYAPASTSSAYMAARSMHAAATLRDKAGNVRLDPRAAQLAGARARVRLQRAPRVPATTSRSCIPRWPAPMRACSFSAAATGPAIREILRHPGVQRSLNVELDLRVTVMARARTRGAASSTATLRDPGVQVITAFRWLRSERERRHGEALLAGVLRRPAPPRAGARRAARRAGGLAVLRAPGVLGDRVHAARRRLAHDALPRRRAELRRLGLRAPGARARAGAAARGPARRRAALPRRPDARGRRELSPGPRTGSR
ncbi:MAG: hypothetical protein QOE36_329 [Gaiellaceae bacterium]|nr:hypothetical protein [Gaiellaceae bacterium]